MFYIVKIFWLVLRSYHYSHISGSHDITSNRVNTNVIPFVYSKYLPELCEYKSESDVKY